MHLMFYEKIKEFVKEDRYSWLAALVDFCDWLRKDGSQFHQFPVSVLAINYQNYSNLEGEEGRTHTEDINNKTDTTVNDLLLSKTAKISAERII